MRIKFYLCNHYCNENVARQVQSRTFQPVKENLLSYIGKIGRFLLDEVIKKAKFSHLRAQFFKHGGLRVILADIVYR